jgi:multiple sugar transport system substrate-binding protein
MKKLFLSMFVVLVALSVVAQVTKPTREHEGKLRIIWTTDDNPVREAQIGIFNKMFPNLDLQIDPSNNDQSKIIVQTMAGIGPDVIDCYDRKQLYTYYQAGILTDITDMAKAAGTTPDICWESAKENMEIDGRQYGFPTNPGPWVVFYNKNIFDKCHVPYPKGDWTWDEFVDTAKKLTIKVENGRNETYGCMGYDLMEAIWQNGGHLYSADGSKCTLDQPEAIEAAQWLMDLQFKHECAPSPSEEEAMAAAGGWGQGIITLFSAEKLGMIRYGRWGLIVWRKAQADARAAGKAPLRIGVAPLPYRKVKATTFATRVSVLNNRSPYIKQAFNFMKFLASKEYGEEVNDAADNCAPVKALCYTEKFLHNPKYPDEDFNRIFRDELKYGRSAELSKFVNPYVADRIFQRHLDLMRNEKETPEEAMKAAAAEIDKEMVDYVAKFPALKAEYERLTQNAKR